LLIVGVAVLTSLKELKATDNSITDIDSISQLPLLATLDLRNNLVSRVEFGHLTFRRLQYLQLGGNQINHISNLDQLDSIEDVYLGSLDCLTLKKEIR
jgi:Leucine-rich repeat (LRR) protein